MNVSSTVLIVIPTYNERENLIPLTEMLRAKAPDADLLIVDDASPDGTGALAEQLRAADRRIHVLHRAGKSGLGRAYVDGFTWGVQRGYELLVQMDADLSHDPAAVPALLAAAQNADVVLGSRYMPGGGIRNWGVVRRALSHFGSLYARVILGLPYRDLTGGFKCWRRSALENVDLGSMQSNGYSFQIEMTFRAARRGQSIAEVPILFTDRTIGQSKMNARIVREAMGVVWRLRLAAATPQARGALQERP